MKEIQNADSSDEDNFELTSDNESDSADELSFESFDNENDELSAEEDDHSESSDEEDVEKKERESEFENLVEEQKKFEEMKKIKDLEVRRKIERVEQANFSEIIKENLRNSDDGYLKTLERNQKLSLNDTHLVQASTGENKATVEYEDDGDSSDEEDIRNTVGNIPLHWYDEYKHIGYDWDGKKIIKPPQRDKIDDFLKKMEDPDFWRTVKDPQTGQDVVLSEDDIQLIKRVMKQKNPDQNYDEYEPWIEWFTSEVEQLPIRNIPDSKKSFLPSKTEKKQIGRLVHSLKMGWMKTKAEQEKIEMEKKQPKFFMLWETDSGREKMRRIHDHVAAPRRALPGRFIDSFFTANTFIFIFCYQVMLNPIIHPQNTYLTRMKNAFGRK